MLHLGHEENNYASVCSVFGMHGSISWKKRYDDSTEPPVT